MVGTCAGPFLAASSVARLSLIEDTCVDSSLSSSIDLEAVPRDRPEGQKAMKLHEELQHLLRSIVVSQQEHLEQSLAAVQSFVTEKYLGDASSDKLCSTNVQDSFPRRQPPFDFQGDSNAADGADMMDALGKSGCISIGIPVRIDVDNHLDFMVSPSKKSADSSTPREIVAIQTKKSLDSSTKTPNSPQKSKSGFRTISKFDHVQSRVEDKSELEKRSCVQESYNRLTKRNGSFIIAVTGIGSTRLNRLTEILSRKHRILDCFRHIVHSNTFSIVLVAMILLNAVFIAISAEHELSNSIAQFRRTGNQHISDLESPARFGMVNAAFFIVFTGELLLRMLALEAEFWIGPECRWNCLDVFLFLTSLADIVLTSSGFQVNFMKLFRLMKMMRSVRLIRVLRFFRQLRLMLLSSLNSLMPLVWAITFLGIIVFVFSVISMQGVTDFLGNALSGDADAESMLEFFDGLAMALLSHLMAVTGGISWWELSRLLLQCSPFYLVIFVLYILVMLLMVLNIVTGIFVTDAIQMAQNDRELSMQTKMEGDNLKFKELKRLFSEIDANQCGKITPTDFEQLMDIPEVSAAFAALGLEISDPVGFFKLLDVDGSMELEIEEFVIGCMQLTGDAKAVSVNMLMSENKRIMSRQAKQYEILNARLKLVTELLGPKLAS